MKGPSNAQTPQTQTAKVLDCTQCGACCSHFEKRRAYIPLLSVDLRRIPERYHLHVVHSDNGFAYLATGEDKRRCVALRGEIGERVSCEIYTDRPEVCRNYEPGSWQCIDARREEGVT